MPHKRKTEHLMKNHWLLLPWSTRLKWTQQICCKRLIFRRLTLVTRVTFIIWPHKDELSSRSRCFRVRFLLTVRWARRCHAMHRNTWASSGHIWILMHIWARQRAQRVWMPRNMVSGHSIGLIRYTKFCVNIALCCVFYLKLTFNFMLNFNIQIHYVDANASSGSAKGAYVILSSRLLRRLEKISLISRTKTLSVVFGVSEIFFQRSLNVLCKNFSLSSEQIQYLSWDQVHFLFSTI